MEVLTINKTKRLKMEKAANRQVHIELGIAPPKSAIYRNKKTYTRKQKYANSDC